MVRYDDSVTFVTEDISYVDGSPVSETTSHVIKCDVQPSTQTYSSSVNGDMQKVKFDVFIPLSVIPSYFENAKVARYKNVDYAVCGIYLKQKFNHEVCLGNNSR